MTYFSTGEVSKKLNLSLRTLRYYDQIGLIEPALKEDNGKRYYTPENMLMLEKVLLLKATSMSLEDIKKIISQITIQKTLSVHKAQLELEVKQLQQSLNYTNTLFNTLKLEGDIHWDQLLPLLSEENKSLKQQKKKKVMEKLFNEEEREALAEQLPKMDKDLEQIEKWINLIKRIELCLEERKTPDSREGQLIAQDTMILSNETFKGNAELADKFWEARKSEENSVDLNLYPVNQEVMAFMEEAILFYEKEQM
ncbi:MerR family transcriptional regulator [Bacillus hwajinpoensis]|uniref:MerR family transcriptional regulator n=1 Tax=Guptibacillus hwajinpoensis TaxID=208199 RepID=A0A845EY50_9BACL|nr:MerR family transcriptional regulator [Pseudalkalibacillus hwajinpoensis]MYL63444.1 MerR family transcriptional regulator [Pseudalkalibacillus hwajinpoensis]